MDQVQITLPCGFRTTYASLQTGSHIIGCMKCDEEHIYIRDVLNRPRNSLILREKHLTINRISSSWREAMNCFLEQSC